MQTHPLDRRSGQNRITIRKLTHIRRQAMKWISRLVSGAFVVAAFVVATGPTFGQEFKSHPALRPLPVPSDRALADGPSFHVDAVNGTDQNDGSIKAPWKTVGHALKQIHAGATLYLHAGIYYERVYCSVAGTKDNPVTIRSSPGELAVIDGSYREFFATPSAAWEPFEQGSSGE